MSGKTFSVNLRRIGACTEGLNNVSDLLEPAAPKTLPMKPQDNKSGSGVKDPDIKTEQSVSTSVKPDGMEIGESIGDASKISLESGSPKILPMKPQDDKSDSGAKGPDIKTEQAVGTSVKPKSMEIGESIGEGLNIKLEPAETKTLPMKPQDNKSGSGVKGPDIKTEPAVGTSVKPNSMEIGENIGDASKISPESGTVTAVKKEVQQNNRAATVNRCWDSKRI